MEAPPNVLLLTFDSCRYDALEAAHTPVLDSFADVLPARSPASYTYAAHHSFFAGLLPNCDQPIPFYNRFTRQLLGLRGVGETAVAAGALIDVASDCNLVTGFRDEGWQTVGAGAMNWFRQATLTTGFQHFRWTGTDADAQVDHLLDHVDPRRRFFGFINFGETHAPFSYAGKSGACPVDVRARIMGWPPQRGSGPVGRDNPAWAHQVEAAEFIDRRLARLFSALPAHTVVIACGDHGECFGEDGFWGHGVDHPVVYEVPLAIFRLDGESVG
ncbi:MAG: Methyltransferase type 11 [Thermoleophilia bacterium]|nr:Methyltransferase type 11 [Thermoleophilia bacterium]